ncbi:UPF0586 protein C9orf41 [Trichinella papuae]|uniref:carnosine N-methyltransferase n=1 Tax=Trichinella papuae TaxID=268474 RepID=A0A0V1M659_9BILA|nr:UPF0586 protein C9orf41 [Trichinella papuae]
MDYMCSSWKRLKFSVCGIDSKNCHEFNLLIGNYHHYERYRTASAFSFYLLLNLLAKVPEYLAKNWISHFRRTHAIGQLQALRKEKFARPCYCRTGILVSFGLTATNIHITCYSVRISCSTAALFENSIQCIHGSPSVPEDEIVAVQFPDIEPQSQFSGGEMSMVARDFFPTNSWDSVCTVFFIDTTANVINYVESIYDILKPGGCWLNFSQTALSPLNCRMIFCNEQLDVPVSYAQHSGAIASYHYNCV